MRQPRSHGLKTGFRPDIEGMRAIAVLLVVAFHFGFARLKGGFIGVDVFFVISGYLITGLLLKEGRSTGTIDFVRFYGRRAKRLLPASLLVISTTLLASWFILSPIEQTEVAKAGASSAVYASNFWFAHLASDYFSPESTGNPFLHTWSLGVEEQFYFVWPALVYLVVRLRVRYAALLIMLAVTVASFALNIWLTKYHGVWAFYASPGRAWEFGVGALFGMIPASRLKPIAPILPLLSTVALVVLFASVFTITSTGFFPGFVALVPVLATAVILAAGSAASGKMPLSLLNFTPVQLIGNLSYSIYLWHWPILVLGKAWFGTPSVAQLCLLLALTGILSWLSYTFVEDPARASRWIASRRWRPVMVGLVLSAGSVAASCAAFAAAHVALQRPDFRAIEAASETPSVNGADPRNCISGFLSVKPGSCSYGPASAPLVVLLGDSHADQWSTPLVGLARAGRIHLLTMVKSSCPAADVPVYNVRFERRYFECQQWRSATMKRIAAMHPYAVVISNFAAGYLRPEPGMATLSPVDWASGLARTIRQLGSTPVLVVRDPPWMPTDVPDCLARATWRRSTGSCDAPRTEVARDALAGAERAALAPLENVTYLDVDRFFCHAGRCYAKAGSTVLYRDAHHVSTAFAVRFAPVFADALRLAPLSSPAGAGSADVP